MTSCIVLLPNSSVILSGQLRHCQKVKFRCFPSDPVSHSPVIYLFVLCIVLIRKCTNPTDYVLIVRSDYCWGFLWKPHTLNSDTVTVLAPEIIYNNHCLHCPVAQLTFCHKEYQIQMQRKRM